MFSNVVNFSLRKAADHFLLLKMSRDSSPARASDSATPNKNGSPLPALPSSWTNSRDSTRSLKDALAAALAQPTMTKPKQTVGGKPQTTASKPAPQSKAKQAPPMAPQPEKNVLTWKDTMQKEMMTMNEKMPGDSGSQRNTDEGGARSLTKSGSISRVRRPRLLDKGPAEEFEETIWTRPWRAC